MAAPIHGRQGWGNRPYLQNTYGEQGQRQSYKWNEPQEVASVSSCSRPVFSDESELVIDKCKRGPFHAVCSDDQLE
jgi:hypothetical protein